MDIYRLNALERRIGRDLNGDGYIGGEGYLSMLERATRRDINGDGYIGRRTDVMPGYPSVYGYPTMQYSMHSQMYPTHGYVGPRQYYY